MTILEGQTVITKPWKNRKKYQTYVFNEHSRRILANHPRQIPSESLEETSTIEPKTLHFYLSYGKLLQLIIDTLYLTKGSQPSQDLIDSCFDEARKAMPPKLDWSEKTTHEIYFESGYQILETQLKRK